MLIKFFRNKGGGSAKSSMNYLLKKADDKYQILRGDPKLSQSIAESCGFKNSYTVGCLSFDEKNISNVSKYEIIERFEKHVFAGLEKEQYNITWIEHTDKDRIELNFYIPNVELTSNKRLQPYYDKADRPLLENFKQVINHEYQLSDPHSPIRQQSLISRADLPKEKQQALKAIDLGISTLVGKGLIHSRHDVIRVLEKSGFEIARITPRNISIKTEGQNLRLKGAFYEQDFRFSRDILSERKTRQRDYDRESEARYRTARERLESTTAKRQQEFERKYPNRTNQIDQTYRHRMETPVYHFTRTGIGINDLQSPDRILGERRISEHESVGAIFENLSERKQLHQTIQLYDGRQDNKSLCCSRSEIRETSLGSKRTPQDLSEIKHYDRNGATTRERFEHIITAARDRYQQIISAHRAFGRSELPIGRAIQGNQQEFNQFNGVAKQVSEQISQQINRQEKKLRRVFSIGF
nr:relaxase/mobilization nuclease domain-containing protein [Candidatus Hamiltonella defensa]